MKAPAASPERVLRQLFWQLVLRGRSAQGARQHEAKFRDAQKLSLVMFALFGMIPAFAASSLDVVAYACLLQAITFFFAALSVVTSAGSMLFVREEAEVLLHRPVDSKHLLRAKVAVLMQWSMLSALAINAAGLIGGLFTTGGGLLFVPTHALAVTLSMTFSIGAVVLLYHTTLRWFGRERLDSLMTAMQVVLMLTMMLGGQLASRLIDPEALQDLDLASGVALALPPAWFGGLTALLCGADPARVWLPAAIGVAATLLVAWLAFARLASSYGVSLQLLGEEGGRERVRRRFVPRLAELPPLRWWLRDRVERSAFALTTAYLLRDREIKLKVYPAIASMLVMPILVVVRPSRRSSGSDSFASFFGGLGLAYVAIVPVQALFLLRRSEHWRASEWLRVAPLEHWLPLFEGARKAVLCWLTVPPLAVVAGILALLLDQPEPLVMGAAVLLVLPAVTTAMGLGKPWLPLAEPPDQGPGTSAGCLLFAGVTLAAFVMAAVAGWLHGLGHGHWFLLGAAGLGFGLQTMMRSEIRAKPWRPERE